jgi:hypothetical protein
MASLMSRACSVIRISAGDRPLQVRPGVRLCEESGHYPRTEPGHSLVRHLLTREQAEEARLPRLVSAEHRHPVVKPDLGIERACGAGQGQVLADHSALAGAPSAQPHPHVLFPRSLLRRAFLLEPAQPGDRRLQPGRHIRVVGGLLPVGTHHLLQLLVLLVPASAQFFQAADPVGARLRVAGEAAAVNPDVLVLGGDDALHAGREQFPVVADQQHGLRRCGQLLLQPALGRHVQVVIRLVEQEHAIGPAQQRLEHQPLLLPAGQRVHVAPAALVVRDAQGRDAAGIPVHLGGVTACLAHSASAAA